MVDPNGFLGEEDVQDSDMLGEGSELEADPSLSESALDFEAKAMEEDGSQHSGGSQDLQS